MSAPGEKRYHDRSRSPIAGLTLALIPSLYASFEALIARLRGRERLL